MVAILRASSLVLFVLLAPADAALAQGASDTLGRWGLLGTWALDCSKPASGSNGYLAYVSKGGGKVAHERDFGDRKDVNDVQQARTGKGGAIELVVHFPGLSQTRRYTMLMGSDGRIRAVANSKVDGTEQTIKDGNFTSNGKATPWQVRCR